MTAPEQKGWWYRATREQKLAQIDAAIELGMTTNQVAMNCGCYQDQAYAASGSPGGTVLSFATYHGRHFDRDSDTKRRKAAREGGIAFVDGKRTTRRKKRLHEAKESYLAGEPVDMWAVE